MLLFTLFLLGIKNELARCCDKLDRSSIGKSLNKGELSLEEYINFLIQLHYYIVPGPDLLAEDVNRMKAAGDKEFEIYVSAHFDVEDTLIPLILTDLENLGVTRDEVKRRGPTKATTDINSYVHKLHHDKDPVFILVSDIAAKVLLDHYTPKIISAIKPKLPDPSKGTGFLTVDTKAQIDIKSQMLKVMRKHINFGNKRRFIRELGKIFDMFTDWLEAIK